MQARSVPPHGPAGLPAGFALAALLLPTLAAAPALGYRLSRVPEDGPTLYWCPAAQVAFTVDDSPLPAGLVPEGATTAVGAAVATWGAISCPPGASPLSVSYAGVRQGAEPGYFTRPAGCKTGCRDGSCDVADCDVENYNVISWIIAPEEWTITESAIAQTSVTYYNATGEIIDADILLNAAHFKFCVGGVPPATTVDLQGVVTHELGHALGLDHSDVSEAVMYTSTQPGPTSAAIRTLNGDDVDGFCAILQQAHAPCGGRPAEGEGEGEGAGGEGEGAARPGASAGKTGATRIPGCALAGPGAGWPAGEGWGVGAALLVLLGVRRRA